MTKETTLSPSDCHHGKHPIQPGLCPLLCLEGMLEDNISKSPQLPHLLGSIQGFESLELNSNLEGLYQNDPTAPKKIAFKLIQHPCLCSAVYKQLRRKYLKSFSTVEWEDVHGYVVPDLSPPLDDHRSILPYCLNRPRLLIAIFKSMYGLLGESRKTLGNREDLPTEAAVQLKYNPIPSIFLGLFDGRLTN